MTETLLLIVGLVLVAYVLLFVEIAVIPGFGVAGIGGLASGGAAAVIAFRSYGTAGGTLVIIGVLAGATMIFRLLSRTRVGRSLVHGGSLRDAHASDTLRTIGERGVAVSDLRPAGIVRFGDDRETAQTEGVYVDAGVDVEVIAIDGTRIVVAPVEGGA